MKPTFPIEEILGTRSRVAVLRVLHRAVRPLSTSEIARRAELTRVATGNALADLEAMNMVHSATVGRAIAHSLNRDHAYVEHVVAPAFHAEDEMPATMEADLARMFEPYAQSVVLFGSYARGQQTDESDVDVAVVTKGPRTDLEWVIHEIDTRFYERWGAFLSTLIYSPEEAATLSERAPSLFSSIVEDGVRVSGFLTIEWKNLGKKTRRKSSTQE